MQSTTAREHTEAISTPANAKAVRRTPAISTISAQTRRLLAAANLPLRYLPESLRPVVNILAISLAIWAPVTIALGPRMASARQTSPVEAAVAAPSHAESTLKAASADSRSPAQDGGH